MTTATFTESIVEEAALTWLEGLGFSIAHSPDIAPDTPLAERTAFNQVALEGRLRMALAQLNPALPPEALDDAYRKITRPEGPTLETRNRSFHRMLVDGVPVEYLRPDGSIAGAQVKVIDFAELDNNNWLAVNQFSVAENLPAATGACLRGETHRQAAQAGKHTRRPDVVLFINGLPLVVIELKNPADENATIWSAFQQLQTYKAELPTLFGFNELLVISDGVEARIGTLTAGREWFKPWRTITGETLADAHTPELQVLINGVFDKRRFLNLLQHFIVLEDAGGWSHSSDLLRKPTRKARTGLGREAKNRPRVRRGDRRRGGRAQEEAQVQVGAVRSHRRIRETPQTDRPGHRIAL